MKFQCSIRFHGLSPIRNISYLLPMCCSFWEKCINSQKNGLGCSTPLKNKQSNKQKQKQKTNKQTKHTHTHTPHTSQFIWFHFACKSRHRLLTVSVLYPHYKMSYSNALFNAIEMRQKHDSQILKIFIRCQL